MLCARDETNPLFFKEVYITSCRLTCKQATKGEKERERESVTGW